MTHLDLEMIKEFLKSREYLLKFNFFAIFSFSYDFLVIFQFWDKFNAFYFCLEIYK